jgi:octaprenyl-diphosphate synthase
MSASGPVMTTPLDALAELEPKLVEYLLTPNEPTNQVIAHIIASGGKRIRPRLFLTCCDLIGYEGPHRHPIAAVCEYIHTASLLHDDVIDNSTLRRGKPTVNSVWGDETAVLAGDLIYAAACRLMVRTGSLPLIDCFAECIRYMSESELYQLQLLWKWNTTQSEYLKVVDGKTAMLFAASCQTPAFLAACDAAVAEALFAYGQALGTAFQIADDCLDYTQSEKQTGKPAVSDLFEGKVTLPLICALENATPSERSFVQGIAAGAVERSLQAQDELCDLVRAHKGVERALDFARDAASTALHALDEVTSTLPHRCAASLQTLREFPASVLNRNA